jgi:hypothetical protein
VGTCERIGRFGKDFQTLLQVLCLVREWLGADYVLRFDGAVEPYDTHFSRTEAERQGQAGCDLQYSHTLAKVCGTLLMHWAPHSASTS